MSNGSGDKVGQQLGNYRLISLLGEGGFAEVYLGEHIYLKTQAAIKVLQAQLAGSEMQQFLYEAQTLVRLRHPHIVKVLEFGMAGNTPYLVMDYAPNGTLRQRHAKGTQLPLSIIVPYVRQVASALSYAHEHQVIHCDIKPENMLLGHRQEILLSDFGLAVITQSSNYQTLELAGTVSYMAPEQVQGKPIPASDQYSLGIVIYEWLSGNVPFSGSFAEVANQHVFTPPPPLRQKLPALSQEIEQVIMISLNKNPQQRFRSIQAFANALEHASQPDQPPRVVPPSPDPPPLIAQIPTAVLTPPQQPVASIAQSQQTVPAPPSTAQTPPAFHTITMTPTPQARRRRPAALTALLSVVALLILVGSGLGYYFAVFQPGQLHLQATATAQSQSTTQARVARTASARETGTARAAATATAFSSTPEGLYMTVTSGTPVFEDPLNSPNDTNWNTFTARDGSGCAFVGGVFHATALQPGDASLCLAPKSNYSDFAFQVQITFLNGNANNFAGFLFRSDPTGADAYNFVVTPQGLYLLANSVPTNLGSGVSQTIQTGLNQPNVFTVIARGSSIYLYANGQFLNKANDTHYRAGAIGFDAFALTAANLPTDAVFQNVKVWTL